MFDLLEPLTSADLLTVDEFAHSIERSRGEVAPLCLLREFLGGEPTDELRKRLRNHFRMRIAVSRILPFATGENRMLHPVLDEFAPQVRHVGREVDVASVPAAIDVGTRAAVVSRPRTTLEPVLFRIPRN